MFLTTNMGAMKSGAKQSFLSRTIKAMQEKVVKGRVEC